MKSKDSKRRKVSKVPSPDTPELAPLNEALDEIFGKGKPEKKLENPEPKS